jgi:putative transposase
MGNLADRLVRHGHGPVRIISTGIGSVDAKRVRIHDRGTDVDDEKIRFASAILPRWARRTKSLYALLPTLYLQGISTGDFQEALAALLGNDAPNLSPSAISRLTAEWKSEYDHWQARDSRPGDMRTTERSVFTCRRMDGRQCRYGRARKAGASCSSK